MGPELFIQPLGDKEFHDCPCCGRCSRRVWGSIATVEHVVACYYVHWTVGQVQEFGANIDLVIGKWGEGASPSERCAVALEYRLLDNGPAVRVIDAGDRLFAESDLAGRALLRDDVVGQPIASDVFAYSDLVLAKDDRISEILGGWSFN